MLTKVPRFSPLTASGTRRVGRIGAQRARIPVARNIAVIRRCIWTAGAEVWRAREKTRIA